MHQTTFLNTELKILILVIYFSLLISGIVLLQEGTRMVPLISSKQLNVKKRFHFQIFDSKLYSVTFKSSGCNANYFYCIHFSNSQII